VKCDDINRIHNITFQASVNEISTTIIIKITDGKWRLKIDTNYRPDIFLNLEKRSAEYYFKQCLQAIINVYYKFVLLKLK